MPVARQPQELSGLALASLFSGAGGLDYGFLASGLPLYLASDLKPDAAATYALNFKVPTSQDGHLRQGHYAVGDIARQSLRLSPPHPPLVLVGGPPCQDFSVLRGKGEERQGTLTLRGRLYLQYARFLALLRPLVFVFENVPGLLSSNGGADIRAIEDDLRNLHLLPSRWREQHRRAPGSTPPPPEDLLALPPGEIPAYRLVAGRVVDASAHGVPQRRKRLILLGFRADLPLGLDHAFFLQEALRGSPALRKYPLTAMEALEGAPLTDLEGVYQEVVAEYGERFPGGHVLEDYARLHGGSLADPLLWRALEEHEGILEAMGWRGSLATLPEGAFPDGSHARAKESPQVLRRMAEIPPGGNHLAVEGTPHQVRGKGLSLVYRRLHPLQPAYTVVAHGGGGTWGYHYRRGLSRLTNRERARLQGFPDGFLFWGSPQRVRAQIGEAVPPLLSLALAQAVLAVLADLGQTALPAGGNLPFPTRGLRQAGA